MPYAVSKDCRGRFVYSARRWSTLRQQKSAAAVVPIKIPLGELTSPALAVPSGAPGKVWVQRNGELKQPESHLRGENHEWMAKSI